ncbi:MAG: family 10 glycosylhydrolase [Planctomycetota bacterium]|nr:family 10 glycosylhydrolase [Planctomycetota bacterium]
MTQITPTASALSRPLACFLATALFAAPALAQRDVRPIRGVWLRPPATTTTLDSYMANFADASITDLFLETFYHGLATNDSAVFQDRFTTDYLATAIRLAARHNIRLHAWVESGYWQFGNTGSYLFANNPEWRVINTATGATGGDQSGQVFANLANPGVQQKLADYFRELADYPGLWGIQTDYHRYPLDNSTSDVYTAPWSYDSWTSATYQTQFNVNINTSARQPGQSGWNNFVTWRREQISQAANVMHQAINAVNPSVEFSAAVFAKAMTDSAQLTKMQNWPSWASRGYIEWVVPMAYGSSTAGIASDLQAANSSASGKRVVAGLAITSGTRPTITEQLNTAKQNSVEDIIFWEGSVLALDATKRAEVKTWFLANATKQRGDFNADLYVDARDRALFNAAFPGSPVRPSGSTRQFDLNNDNWIDTLDLGLFLQFFTKFRFGEDGIVDQRDLDAFLAAFTGPGSGSAPAVLNMYDLDGDGDVDYSDQLIMHSLINRPVTPDLDVNRDGKIGIDDLYVQNQAPIDVNRSGTITPADQNVLEAAIRANELTDMGQR